MKAPVFWILLFALGWLLPVADAQSGGESQATARVAASAKITDYTLPPDKLQKAHALYEIDIWLGIVETIYGFLILYALLRWRVTAKYRDWAEAVSGNRFADLAWVSAGRE